MLVNFYFQAHVMALQQLYTLVYVETRAIQAILYMLQFTTRRGAVWWEAVWTHEREASTYGHTRGKQVLHQKQNMIRAQSCFLAHARASPKPHAPLAMTRDHQGTK